MGVGEIRSSTQSYSALIKQPGKQRSSSSPQEDAMPVGRATQDTPVLTRPEKQYFASLFPQSSAEINRHQVYTPTGKKTTILPGTIVDKKG